MGWAGNNISIVSGTYLIMQILGTWPALLPATGKAGILWDSFLTPASSSTSSMLTHDLFEPDGGVINPRESENSSHFISFVDQVFIWVWCAALLFLGNFLGRSESASSTSSTVMHNFFKLFGAVRNPRESE